MQQVSVRSPIIAPSSSDLLNAVHATREFGVGLFSVPG